MEESMQEPVEEGDLEGEIGEETHPGSSEGNVRADNIEFTQGIARDVSAREKLTMKRSLAVSARSEQDMEVQDSLAVSIVAGRNAAVANSLTQVMVVGGNSDLSNSVAQMVVAGGSVTVNKGFIGIINSPQVTLGEGSRVLLNTRQAMAFGAVLGVVFALVSFVLRGRKRCC
jgi:hypothetical protein